ncbi:DUF3817 domain-containing protein [Psychrobacter alimentarius]|uniref:DUF3817 domain-containing protein n=1 Tax=Psychrobacter alimentarius TaxID=261164 RepID=UPI001917B57C|nr:DUF3817 domain-containing protein [Psychrobacter alimentarius]
MKKGQVLYFATIAEASTLLILIFIAMPLKYGAGLPMATSIMGPIHGLTFMMLLWCIFRSLGEGLISWTGTFRLLIAAVIPFGGVINEQWLRNKISREY